MAVLIQEDNFESEECLLEGEGKILLIAVVLTFLLQDRLDEINCTFVLQLDG